MAAIRDHARRTRCGRRHPTSYAGHCSRACKASSTVLTPMSSQFAGRSDFGRSALACGTIQRSKPMRARFAQPERRLRDRAHFSAESDLAEDGRARSRLDDFSRSTRPPRQRRDRPPARRCSSRRRRSRRRRRRAGEGRRASRARPATAKDAADRCRSPSGERFRTCCC